MDDNSVQSTSEIRLFVPTFCVEECLKKIESCLRKGWTGIGDLTYEFEAVFAKAFGLPHAHFLNSCSAALHIAVKLLKDRLGWTDGDEVITTPITFVSTNHSILYEKLTPVFADVDSHLCLDPASVEARITARTRAVMFVGIGGNTGQWHSIVSICRRHGLALILDAAHMVGTTVLGKNPALDADATAYSFQAVKNLPTGDSGMLCFADPDLDADARKLSWLGIDSNTFDRMREPRTYRWNYDVSELGYKYNGNALMAAIALSQISSVEEDNKRRRGIANLYERLLSDKPSVELVPSGPDCISSRHLFQVKVGQRDKIIERMNRAQIFPGVHYRTNMDYGLYREFADRCPPCPNAAQVSKTVLSLPLHLRLTDEEISRVADCLVDSIAVDGLV